MRPLSALVSSLVLAVSAHAAPVEIPQVLALQGRLLDASDHAAQGAHRITVRVFDVGADPVGGPPVVDLWHETYPVLVVDGMFAITLGDQSGNRKALPPGLFEGAQRFLEIAVDDGAVLLPRLRIAAAPYALVAAHAAKADAAAHAAKADDADTVGGESPADLHDATRLVGTVPAASLEHALLRTGGSISGNVGIGLGSAAPAARLHVGGTVKAEAFEGSGAGVTGVDAATVGGKPATAFALTGDLLTVDAAQLGGRVPADYALASALGTVDATKLGGKLPAEYALASALTSVNAIKLEGHPASDFVLATSQAGNLTINGSVKVGADTAVCTDAKAGAIRWTGQLEVCAGAAGGWTRLAASVGIDGSSSAKAAPSCAAIQRAGLAAGNGSYWLDVDGTGSLPPFLGYCDMTTDGGGWTLVLRDNWDTTEVPKTGTQLPSPLSVGTAGSTGDYVGPWQLHGQYLYVCKSCSGDNAFISNQSLHPSRLQAEVRTGSYDQPMMTLAGGQVVRADSTPNNRLNYFSNYDGTASGCGPISSSRDNGNNCWNNFFGPSYWENLPGGNAGLASAAGHVSELYVRELAADGSSSAKAGASCRDLRRAGMTADGLYWVDPDGGGSVPAQRLWCDMTTDGGGWTLVATRSPLVAAVTEADYADAVPSAAVNENRMLKIDWTLLNFTTVRYAVKDFAKNLYFSNLTTALKQSARADSTASNGGARSVTSNRDTLLGTAVAYASSRPGWLTDSASGTSWCWWDEVYASAHKGVGSCDGTDASGGRYRGGIFVR